MSLNIGDIANLSLSGWNQNWDFTMLSFQLQNSLPKELTLNVVELQQLPGIENTDSKKEISCIKWTKYKGKRKVCVNFKIDSDNLNFVVYRYRNSLYLKDKEVDL